jgi:cysteine-rich repeat protein
MSSFLKFSIGAIVCCLSVLLYTHSAYAVEYSTTTLTVSICGDAVVNSGEQCDVPGDTGLYSTTIAGRQCNAVCKFGPYCGDGILQTIYGEECDDANNTDDDFCSAACLIEPAANGGGSSSGGGSGGGGGSSNEIGDTQISIEGYAYPSRTVNILLDGESIGNVRANSSGEFSFATDVSPGATTLGFWSTDNTGVRSITLSTTFDVTQGAITNINSVLLPPSISLSTATVDPGDPVTVRGQAASDTLVELYVDNELFATTQSGIDGIWSIELNTATLSNAEHILKARYVRGSSSLKTESSFSTALQLFVGVDGQPSNNSDLNRDGRIDLIDFSILIFWWQTNGGDSDPPADINGNANVGLEDFSILLFNWTG